MADKLFSDQLRKAIQDCGQTQYRVAKESGVAQPHLSTFLSGQTGLSLAAVDKLCKYLRLQLVSPKKRER
jgi:transcriptional regulator with XRE-family HTH domain